MIPKYLIVETKSLPEVFLKVVKAKELLLSGQAKTATQAAQQVGVSRTAFYKYKDKVYPYSENEAFALVTINFLVKDEPGVLSNLLLSITNCGGNIMTIYQNIPSYGVAPITLCIRTNRMQHTVEEMLENLQQKEYVLEAMVVKAE